MIRLNLWWWYIWVLKYYVVFISFWKLCLMFLVWRLFLLYKLLLVFFFCRIRWLKKLFICKGVRNFVEENCFLLLLLFICCICWVIFFGLYFWFVFLLNLNFLIKYFFWFDVNFFIFCFDLRVYFCFNWFIWFVDDIFFI